MACSNHFLHCPIQRPLLSHPGRRDVIFPNILLNGDTEAHEREWACRRASRKSTLSPPGVCTQCGEGSEWILHWEHWGRHKSREQPVPTLDLLLVGAANLNGSFVLEYAPHWWAATAHVSTCRLLLSSRLVPVSVAPVAGWYGQKHCSLNQSNRKLKGVMS